MKHHLHQLACCTIATCIIFCLGCGKPKNEQFSFPPVSTKQALTVQDGAQVEMTMVMHIGKQFIKEEVGQAPKTYIFGRGLLFPALEKQMKGMAIGEKKTITLSPQQAYGLQDMSKIFKVPRASLPPDLKLEPGEIVNIPQPDGTKKPAMVRQMVDDFVVMDFNNPLAGQIIVYDIEIKNISYPG